MRRNRYYKRRKVFYSNSFEHTFASQYDSSKSFLLNKFLSLHPNKLVEFGDVYRLKHGNKSYNYFLEAYPKWKSKKVRVSDQTVDRLLEIVPKFLLKDEQYELLKIELEEFIGEKFSKFKNRKVPSNELESLYKEALELVINFDSDDLRWFVTSSFQQQEIVQFVSFSKYVLSSKLKHSYESVIQDLIEIDKFNKRNVRYRIRSEYRIDLLDSEITNIESLDSYHGELYNFVMHAKCDRIESGIEMYVMNEIIKLRRHFDESEVMRNINKKDLLILENQLQESTSKGVDIYVTGKFNGKGGQLNMDIEFIDPRKLREGLVLNWFLITFSFTLSMCVVAVNFTLVIPKNFRLFYAIFSIIAFGLLIKAISISYSKVTELRRDLKFFSRINSQ